MGASEGVDNLRRVSGTFARSMTLTKNPLLTTVNDDDDKESPSGFLQREANISTNLEEKNAPGKKSLGRFLSLSTGKKKHEEERLREEKKAEKRQTKVASAIQHLRTVREAASAAKRTHPTRGFTKGFRQVVDLRTIGGDLITSFNVKFRRVFEFLRCVDPDEDNEALSKYTLLHPKSPIYILWKRMINCLVMMVCFVLPALIAFNYSDMPALRYEQDLRLVKSLDLQKKEQLESTLDGFLLFVDLCFCLDVLGNFFAPFF